MNRKEAKLEVANYIRALEGKEPIDRLTHEQDILFENQVSGDSYKFSPATITEEARSENRGIFEVLWWYNHAWKLFQIEFNHHYRLGSNYYPIFREV